VLAAQLGFSADECQKRNARALIKWEDNDDSDAAAVAAGGDKRRVVCEGVAKNLVPLLTGFTRWGFFFV
jgi:hypothetical protein